MATLAYYTDLTDAEWALLAPQFPLPAGGRGRPRRQSVRTIVQAILYVLRTGCAWRVLPRDWPAWQTVYHWFRTWRRDGTWLRIHTTLREQLLVQLGRDPQPSAGIVDSQSVETTGVGGERGYDGGKQVKGRKRPVLVDTEGLILNGRVHPANLRDRDETTRRQFPPLRAAARTTRRAAGGRGLRAPRPARRARGPHRGHRGLRLAPPLRAAARTTARPSWKPWASGAPPCPARLVWDNAPPPHPKRGQAAAAAANSRLVLRPLRAPELMPCEDRWRLAKAVVAANRVYETVQEQAERAGAWLTALSPFDRLLKCGLFGLTFQWLAT